MKKTLFISLISSAVILTSCSVATPVTDSSVEQTSATVLGTNVESSDESSETTDASGTVAGNQEILGHENWHMNCVANQGSASSWTDWVFVDDDTNEVLGEWFGFDEVTENIHIADIDGDGTNELICNCQYGGDCARRVMVYRNNNGTIEVGTATEESLAYNLDLDIECTLDYQLEYDERTGQLELEYNRDGSVHTLNFDCFSYEPYVYEE